MKKSKILIFSLAFVLIILFALGLNTNVKATTGIDGTETESVSVAGAKIRTSGTAGIRFVAEISEDIKEGATKYGVALAFGEADASEILVNGTVNDKNVLTGEIDAATLEEGATEFYVNLINIPNTMYGQKITARAYVVKGEEYHYANTATTRCLGEVVLKASAAGEVAGNEFLEGIYADVVDNYKKVFIDQQGQLHIDNPIYETNTANLAKVFVADWNEMFSTTLDASTAFTGGTSSTWYKSAKTSSQTDWSTSKLKSFFQDSTMYAKWGWLLNYIITELSNGTGHSFAKSQANAIINNVEDTANWYYSGHLCSFIMSTMTGEYQSSGWGSYSFQKNPTKLGLIVNYNNTILADLNNSQLVLKGEFTLPKIDKNGYQFDGWTDGTNNYTVYNVAEENVLLAKSYTAVDYTITYYYGETELTEFESHYTIEDSVTLPTNYVVNGYKFDGWYEESDFSGSPITTIEVGNTGNKVFYAKMVETSYVSVDVNFDLNEGSWDYNYLLENAEVLYTAQVTRYKTYTSNGSEASLHTRSVPAWWHYILLNETDIPNVYKIINKGAASSSGVSHSADYSLFYHDDMTDTDAYVALNNLRKGSSVGDYVLFDNIPSTSGSCLIDIYVIDNIEATKNSTQSYTEVVDLPTPVRKCHNFVGWKSSLDDSIITKYPGYDVNPGEITYTAQWETNYADVNVSFDCNGGALLRYNSVDDAIADFLKDYNTARSKTHTPETFYALGSWGEISDASLFLYNANYKSKWTWLVNYIATVASSKNKAAFTNFYNYNAQSELNAANSNYIYCVAYELRGWVGQAKYSQNANFVTADYSSATVKSAYDTAVTLPTEYVYSDPCTLPIPVRPDYTFMGWKSSVDSKTVTEYPGYDTSVTEVVYTAVWQSKYASVTAGFDPNGGMFDPKNVSLDPINEIIINEYSNICPDDKIYMCDTSVTSYSSLLYVYKILLNYDKDLDLYLVVGVDVATKKANDMGVTWTHALCHNKSNFTPRASVGDYIQIDKDSLASGNQTAYVYSVASLSSYSQVYDNKATLPVPIKVGYTFNGWKSSIDGEVYFEIPAYDTDPGEILFTAQWKALPLSVVAEVSYDTDSYVVEGKTISLSVKSLITSSPLDGVTWTSADNNIATVNNDGVVTGVSAGYTTIRAATSEEDYFDFGITVVSEEVSGIIQTILTGHNSNVYATYNLGIGAGTPVYYTDVIGSVNNIMFNESLTLNTKYLATGNNNKGGTVMSSIDFVTVHYTGNMAAGADAEANAGYFVGTGTTTSIHYTTGNDGVFHCLDNQYAAAHAGHKGGFSWVKTNIKVSASDPKYPTFGINSNSNFTLNGVDTGVKVPNETSKGYGYVTDSKWLNDMGLAYKTEDGYYYIGSTYWCYSQVAEGRICSNGGNDNSIGIESCVNKGSDLWYTWHKTAQLCAKLLNDNNLGMERLVGHHFFTAKDCPQPMLENDLEIWYIFRDMVESELDLLQNYSNYTISMEVLEGNVNSVGRVTQGEYGQLITYKVTVTNKTTSASESIILSSIIEGTNSK